MEGGKISRAHQEDLEPGSASLERVGLTEELLFKRSHPRGRRNSLASLFLSPSNTLTYANSIGNQQT